MKYTMTFAAMTMALGTASAAPQTGTVKAAGYELAEMNYVFIREDAEVLSQPILSEPVTGADLGKASGDAVVVKLDKVVQPSLAGLGGAFSRPGGEAFMSLPEAERKTVAKALFNPEKGAGLSLYQKDGGSTAVEKGVLKAYPKLKLSKNEGAFYGGENSVAQAKRRFNEIAKGLYQGAGNISSWNIARSAGAKSGAGLPPNALLEIDPATGSVGYNRDFAAVALLGRYIRPGDQLLQARIPNAQAIAVRNDERLVVMLDNPNEMPVPRQIDLGGRKYSVELPAQSVCAFVFRNKTSASDADKKDSVYGTITEESPSIPQYFSWINNTNEGSTEQQTLANLGFFKWLYEEYGMNLGIYAWDAGNIDSARYYGNMESEKFKHQFPNGWKSSADLAKSFGVRLGLWGGPDGFGDTPEEEQARIDLLVSFCRDYGVQLFKFDSVCTQLRDEKQGAFARAMTACREYAPDLVVLNHRLNLGEAKPHATTFLWGGAETYIDVHMRNRSTAPHNRAGAMSRGLPPELKRLTEDHGVCISSCLDFWEDDLILQAFNRCLILAPEIYGNPWLLRDDEFAKLGRIFNLHFRNREIMVKGMVLPEATYGKNAVARGDGATRFISLRNLSWEPKTFTVSLNEEIGLTDKGPVEVRRYHPSERILGSFGYGKTVQVEVAPYRSYLLMATTRPCNEIGVAGCDYEVVRDTEGKPALVKLLGLPGTGATVSLKAGDRSFGKAFLGDRASAEILGGGTTIHFPGKPVAQPWHKKLAELKPVDVPADAEALYEATCFSAENDALEVQSLRRSGPSAIADVNKARDAFFDQELFWRRGIWDKYMFDDNLETFFSVYHYNRDARIDGGALRIDFSAPQTVDRISLRALQPASDKGQPPMELAAEVSDDLKNWKSVTFKRNAAADGKSHIMNITKNGGASELVDAVVYSWELKLPKAQSFRYIRIFNAPGRVAEFAAMANNKKLEAANWHATHLFAPFSAANPAAAWQAAVQIEGNAAEGSYLCVALDGRHGANKAFAALRVDGKWVGASQRAPSFPCVAWEYPVRSQEGNDTFFFPVTDELRGKNVEVVVLGLSGGKTAMKPHAWITAGQTPNQAIMLRLEK
jgi:hypothetical protein